jgi:hypothetical protein
VQAAGGGAKPAVSGLRRRRAATSPANSISSSRPRFKVQLAPRRSVHDGEAAKGGRSDGVAEAQALGAAVRRRKSGDGSKATGCTGTAEDQERPSGRWMTAPQ